MNSHEGDEDRVAKRRWNVRYLDALLKAGGVDFILMANQYTLLNFEAVEDGLLQRCAEAGVSVIVGGPFSTGILATGADPKTGATPYFNYDPAPAEVRARCRRIEVQSILY